MKKISVYALHTWINDIERFITFFNLNDLKNEFEFEWNPINPDYLFVTDGIYHRKKMFNEFKDLYDKSKIKVCFASEAFTPDFNLFDYCIGWDIDLHYSDRYCLLPPARGYVARTLLTKDNSRNSIKDFIQSREELLKKDKFCNFIYSNWLAHPMRDNLFYEISKYKRVDSLGRHLKNVQEKIIGFYSGRFQNIDVKRRFKFSIASENAHFSGYTTEKIYTSLLAHTIPIYWGDPQVTKYINPRCFINVADYSSFDDLRARIKEIDENDNLWCQMISEPWHTTEQELEIKNRSRDYHNFIRNIFNQEISLAKRRPEGTFVYMYNYRFFKGYKSKFKIYKEIILHKLSKL